jgi:diguanylate cyclase (GGDEF)-like protein
MTIKMYMDPIARISVERAPIYRTVSKVFGLDPRREKNCRQQLFCLTPPAIFTSPDRINRHFLPFLADKIVESLPGAASAEELVAELGRANLADEPGGQLPSSLRLGHVYEAMIAEQTRLLARVKKNAGVKTELRQVRTRNDVLVKLDDSLSLEPQSNRVLIMTLIQQLFNISNGLAYTVRRGDHNWKTQHKTDPKTKSGYEDWRLPERGSEKHFINEVVFDLPRLDLPSTVRTRIMAQIVEGSCALFMEDEWGYFYIPNREKCSFINPLQIAIDVGGDLEQDRVPFGDSAKGEDFYFFLKNPWEDTIEVSLLHNWRTNRPLFKDMEKDLETLRGFAQSCSKSMKLVSANQELEQKNAQLEELSVTDPLTGLHNRRYFDKKMVREVKRARGSRQHNQLGLLTIDIDNFKKINDAPGLGHPAGDQVLREAATIFKGQVRELDSVSRAGSGSDEFMVIMPETNAIGVGAAAKRIRAAIEAHSFNYAGNMIPVTVSIGGSIYVPPVSAPPADRGERILTPVPEEVQCEVEALIGRADKALYNAKNGLGRNNVAVMLTDGSWLDIKNML